MESLGSAAPYRTPRAVCCSLGRVLDLVGPDLRDLLLAADQVALAVGVEHDLGALGEGVVVLRAHGRAVGARALDDDHVARRRVGAEGARQEDLGLVRGGGHQVAGLAAVADGDEGVVGGADGLALGGLAVHEDERVLRAVERGAEQLGHARVELEEREAALARRDEVLHRGDERTRVGDEEGARLDLELHLDARALGVLLEGRLHRRAHRLQVGARLTLHAAHLVAAAQVEDAHGGDLLAQREREPRHLLPHRRVRARADVRVHARGLQVVLLDDRLHLRHELVPDAEGGGGAAHVGLARAAAAQPRVEAHAQLVGAVPLARLAVRLQLAERARIVLDTEVEQLGQVGRELLRAQADLVRGDARRHRPAHLVPAARVDVQPEPVEELQHRRVRQRLHGEAYGQAEGVREVERLKRLPLERRLVVHEERRAKLLAKLQGALRSEEAQLLRLGHRRRRRASGSGGDGHRRRPVR
mmetsp:Transcript_15716/g.38954  ORF Transcript_15716/g.38954 Transcript_15716/m.38954 type:complete len:473 (-) Transcript_15716:19-1437(-)